jgi:hypothetical protein
MTTNHERGADPTPQGRTPQLEQHATQSAAEDSVSEKYENSAPGPDARKDGAYFFGYKRDNTGVPPKG